MIRIILFIFYVICLTNNAFACGGWLDLGCNIGKVIEKGAHDAGNAIEKGVHDAGNALEKGTSLTPVREYLNAAQIPPPEAGAYGMVVFQYKMTSANEQKLTNVCHSFLAFFPKNETSDVPIHDRMITIWPVDDPEASQVKQDDCKFIIEHYDLNASEAAVRDAKKQNASFDGEGPYLVGWSPSNTRGASDKLVLVIDMSNDNDQSTIDHQFLFWKTKIVEDPTLWRNGFSLESFRIALQGFANQFGDQMVKTIKLVGYKAN